MTRAIDTAAVLVRECLGEWSAVVATPGGGVSYHGFVPRER